jgi:hypothetical protein
MIKELVLDFEHFLVVHWLIDHRLLAYSGLLFTRTLSRRVFSVISILSLSLT